MLWGTTTKKPYDEMTNREKQAYLKKNAGSFVREFKDVIVKLANE